MNHDEATRYFDTLGERVSSGRPAVAGLIVAGRAVERRKARRTLALVAASVALVLGGGAVARGVGADADAPQQEIDPLTREALRDYDPQAMPELMDKYARAAFGRSIDDLPVSEFRADDTSFQALPAARYREAQSMEVLYRLPDRHELWFYIGHGKSHAEGDARRICEAGLESGSYLECEVQEAGKDVALVTVNASAAGWMGRELGLQPSKGDDPDDRQVVSRDDLDAVDSGLLMFERTVKVVHSETFVSVVRESVSAPDLATADEAFQVPVADMIELATDPSMVIPEPATPERCSPGQEKQDGDTSSVPRGPDYPTNPSGLTYGAAGGERPEPDLIAVVGDCGHPGYVFGEELEDPEPWSAEAGLDPDVSRTLPVFTSDGVTQVDTFTLGGSESGGGAGSTENPSPGAPTGPESDALRGDWSVIIAGVQHEDGTQQFDTFRDVAMTAIVEGDSLRVFDGCQTWTATFRLVDGEFSLTRPFVSDARKPGSGCGRQAPLVDILENIRHVSGSGAKVHLHLANFQIVLVLSST